MEGQIVKIISNLYFVLSDNKTYKCNSRGNFRLRKITPVVGDYCKFDPKTNYILDILPRKNYLDRPLVANVDQGVIVTSLVTPSFSTNLLDKLITVLEINNIKPIICITKEDMISEDEKELFKTIISYYKSIGYQVFYNTEIEEIKKIFKDKTTVFTGQTGAGKSSLLNKLDPNLNLEVGEVSLALGRGKHTTRIVSLINLFGGKVVDTPGFSSIDLSVYSPEEIRNSFIEFNNCSCLYKDCSHTNEELEICEVKRKVEQNEILKSRYEDYISFITNERRY